jgi:hypothetical protein
MGDLEGCIQFGVTNSPYTHKIEEPKTSLITNIASENLVKVMLSIFLT